MATFLMIQLQKQEALEGLIASFYWGHIIYSKRYNVVFMSKGKVAI